MRRLPAARIFRLVLAACLAGVGVGCSDDDKGGGDTAGDHSIEAYLGQLPASVATDDVMIVYGDIDRAADLADTPRPDRDTSELDGDGIDELIDWMIPLTGLPREGSAPIFVPLPEASNPDRIQRSDEIDDEFGWSGFDVSSFIEYQVPPGIFTVMDGTFTEGRIDAAIGDREDGIWRLGGEDFEVDHEAVSAARPLGESVRLAWKDGRVAYSRSTPPITAWLEGGETLASDDELVAVAKALDAAGAYSALIVNRAGGGFLGIGLTLDGDEAGATFVYGFRADGEAEANVDRLTDLLENGTSDANGRPWSDLVTIDSISTEGNVLVASLQLGDLRPVNVFQIVYARDNLASL